MNRSRHKERGQTILLVVLGMGLFLLAAVGFGVDYSNAWFHRQSAQAAADAACSAGAMDMLEDAGGASLGGGNFLTKLKAGTSFDCSSGGEPNSVPCQYAAQNGYAGAGLLSGAASNSVSVSFPSSIPGVAAPASGLTSAIGSNPFMQVDVVDRVPAYFSQLVTGSSTIDVRASARCGVVSAKAPIPILVLHPSMSGSLSLSGTPTISVYGGGPRGIQVNSTSATAATGGGTINLSQGGSGNTGSDVGITGAENTACCSFNGGTTGKWVPRTAPVLDPLALVCAPGQTSNCSTTLNGFSAPAKPGPPSVPADLAARGCASIPCTGIPYHVHGCPDAGGCDVYTAGDYTGLLQVKNKVAVFDPGLYYLENGLALDSNSVVRSCVPGLAGCPASAGDGNQGATFYFYGGSVSVAANSGGNTTDSFPATATLCSGVPVAALPGNISATTTFQGNIFVAPCTGYYGDALGENHGVLFFQNRAVSATADWGGGGAFALAGIMYFHQCVTSGSDKGTGCSSSAYNTTLTLGGNSGSNTYILGEIIADQIGNHGTPSIIMDLSSTAKYNILKASLLQ